MYGGFDVFRTYLAVKMHFTTDTYNYAKYEGRVNAGLETFTKRNDRYFFHKLSKRYGQDQIVDYFVANFLADSKKWIGNLISDEGADEYNKFRKYKESIGYHFRNDCVYISDDFNRRNISFDNGFGVHNGQHPRALRLLIQKKIHFQTAFIMDSIISFSKDWNNNIEEKVVWTQIYKKFVKMKPFIHFNRTQAKLTMKEVFTK